MKFARVLLIPILLALGGCVPRAASEAKGPGLTPAELVEEFLNQNEPNQRFENWLMLLENTENSSGPVDFSTTIRSKIKALTKVEARKIAVLYTSAIYLNTNEFSEFEDSIFKISVKGEPKDRLRLGQSLLAVWSAIQKLHVSNEDLKNSKPLIALIRSALIDAREITTDMELKEKFNAEIVEIENSLRQ